MDFIPHMIDPKAAARGVLLAALFVAASGCVSNANYLAMEAMPGTPAALQARVYLLGDGGLDSPGRDAVLAHARADLLRHVDEHPDVPAIMVFLGDNIYDVGARRASRDEDLAKLAAQVRAVVAAPTVRGVFLPGNHDWGHGAPDPEGRTAIEIQQRWIDEIKGAKNVGFLPADECPGPVVVDVRDDVHVVFIDTEWLLRLPGGCGGEDLFYERLTRDLRNLQGGRVLLVAHHPMATGGPHGGNVGIMQTVPVLYYLAIKSGLSVQDPASGRYSHMLRRLRAAIEASGTRPLAMATGHDHSLQVIRLFGGDVPVYQLVSGSASKSSAAARIDGTRYATSAHGYMRLDFAPDRTELVAFALDGETGPQTARVRPVFSCRLSYGVEETCPEAPLAGAGR